MLIGSGVWRFGAFFAHSRQTPTALPLLISETFAETGLMGVWEITEPADNLLAVLPHLPDERAEARALLHPQKRLEFAASRALLRYLTGLAGLPYDGLSKDDFGKPTLRGHAWHLSLTHDGRYAAAVMHPSHPVGIDLETPRETLRRVAPRVLSPTELAHADNDLHRLAVYWTAKEALYKLYGKRGLFFSTQLHVAPFGRGDDVVTGAIQTEGLEQTCRITMRRVGDAFLAVAV